MGSLYVAGVPGGSAADLTLRVRRILAEVVLVATADAGQARRLLADCGAAATPIVAADDAAALAALERGDVALLLPAVLPGPRGPDLHLVQAAIERGWPVVPLPGPSLVVAALVISGLPADGFVCLGELPRQAPPRRALLAAVAAERRTLIALAEPPHLGEALAGLHEALGERPLSLVATSERGTGLAWRGSLGIEVPSGALEPAPAWYALVVGGAQQKPAPWDEGRLRAEIDACLAQSLGAKETSRQLAAPSGWPRREVYRLVVKAARERRAAAR